MGQLQPRMKRSLRPFTLASAFEAVARVNHYMVGIVEKFTDEELDAAEQVLIDRQNVCTAGKRHKTLGLALDLVGNARLIRRMK